VATAPEQSLERHFAPGGVWEAGRAWKYIGHPLILGGLSSTLFAVSRKSQDKRTNLAYALIQGSIISSAVVQPASWPSAAAAEW
jgi:hypothetical protein